MWREFNPSPVGKRVGDCAVRAVAKALDIDWETAYAKIALQGFIMCDMPSADAVWAAVLRQNGFQREAIPNDLPQNYTVSDFARDHPGGVYVLAIGGHVLTVENGQYWDSWDSGSEIPQYYFGRA